MTQRPDLVDFHNHVIPGIDDGAQSIDEALAALRRFREEGVATVVATPHFEALRPEGPETPAGAFGRIDAGWARLIAAAEAGGLDMRLERGAEIRLYGPKSDLSDPRLGLAGTCFRLVEFADFRVPSDGAKRLHRIREQGWLPILAHPERYRGVSVEIASSWREAGARFQLNHGSLLGRYGPTIQRFAWRLLALGWADYLSSDYHAHGSPGVAAVLRLLGEQARGSHPAGVACAIRRLTVVNPMRMLSGEEPLPVPPLHLACDPDLPVAP